RILSQASGLGKLDKPQLPVDPCQGFHQKEERSGSGRVTLALSKEEIDPVNRSYSALENNIRHRLRDDLNHAGEPQDARNAFALAVRHLLRQATGEDLRFTDNDIRLKPEAHPCYELDAVITGTVPFQVASADSDLLVIIGRFAEAACHRHKALVEHADKIRARVHKEH